MNGVQLNNGAILKIDMFILGMALWLPYLNNCRAGISDPRLSLYVQTQVVFDSRFDFSLLDANIPLCDRSAAML